MGDKDEKNVALGLAIFEFILRYGAPAVIEAIRAATITTEWTPEAIRALKVDEDVRGKFEG